MSFYDNRNTGWEAGAAYLSLLLSYIMNITQFFADNQEFTKSQIFLSAATFTEWQKSILRVFKSKSLQIRHAASANKLILPKIDKRWSGDYTYGYCIAYLKKNDCMIIVNAMFNDLRLYQDESLFTMRFRGKNKCNACKRRRGKDVKLKQCSQCKDVAYCSRKCQKYDWKHKHRFYCSAEPFPISGGGKYSFKATGFGKLFAWYTNR